MEEVRCWRLGMRPIARPEIFEQYEKFLDRAMTDLWHDYFGKSRASSPGDKKYKHIYERFENVVYRPSESLMDWKRGPSPLFYFKFHYFRTLYLQDKPLVEKEPYQTWFLYSVNFVLEHRLEMVLWHYNTFMRSRHMKPK